MVVAESLTAADVVLFSRRSILGCATDYGGATSHVSIMARSLGVPAVVSMHGVTEHVTDGERIILDGIDGRIIVHPSPATLKRYEERRRRYDRLLLEQKELVPLSAETRDGHRVSLRANVEFEEELPLLEEYGAYAEERFEIDLLSMVPEDEQTARLDRAAEAIAGSDRPVIVAYLLIIVMFFVSASAYATVRAELEAYGAGLAQKPEIVALNKTDAVEPDVLQVRKDELEAVTGGEVNTISGVTGENVRPLLGAIWRAVEAHRTRSNAETGTDTWTG